MVKLRSCKSVGFLRSVLVVAVVVTGADFSLSLMTERTTPAMQVMTPKLS